MYVFMLIGIVASLINFFLSQLSFIYAIYSLF